MSNEAPWSGQRHRGLRRIDRCRVFGFLVGGAASGMTGDTIYVCAGLHIMA
jgi:enoyl-[acyl-carrier-protein] reductase (NADH)